MTTALEIRGLRGIPEVRPGADLAALIADAAERDGGGLRDGDVVVVTAKVVSKAEGRLVDLRQVEPSALARDFAEEHDKDARHVEVVLRETRRVVRMLYGVLIAETRHGFVCANAGVDASNVPGEGVLCLLPVDSDASAEALRTSFKQRLGVELAVIVTDSFGRPWRNGAVNVAIGIAGMDPFADYRGQHDPYGYLLMASRTAVADELASAAELVMGKLDAIPVAVIRGFKYGAPSPGAASGRDMVMDPERNLFR